MPSNARRDRTAVALTTGAVSSSMVIVYWKNQSRGEGKKHMKRLLGRQEQAPCHILRLLYIAGSTRGCAAGRHTQSTGTPAVSRMQQHGCHLTQRSRTAHKNEMAPTSGCCVGHLVVLAFTTERPQATATFIAPPVELRKGKENRQRSPSVRQAANTEHKATQNAPRHAKSLPRVGH